MEEKGHTSPPAAHSRRVVARQGREFRIWQGMVRRCCDPKGANYDRYGARGITVCDEWRDSFESFLAHIGPSPSAKHTVDRIDGARGYEPGNVRWATQKEQQNNRRNNHRLIVHGESRTIAEWSSLTGTGWWAIRERLRRGWSPERAVLEPPSVQAKPRRHWLFLMTAEERADIVRRYVGGETITSIARQQRVAPSSVRRLLRIEAAA